jgi:hypothetical protein
MKAPITLLSYGAALVAMTLTSCAHDDRGASSSVKADGVYAEGTFVYRDEQGGDTYIRARLSEAESQTLYRAMTMEPEVGSQANIKSIRTADEGFDVYCLEPTSPIENWACTLSIKESLIGGFSDTLVQYNETKPLIHASVYQWNTAKPLFLAFDTQKNLDKPSYERDLTFDKAKISLWIGGDEHLKTLQVAMTLNLPE